jgi:hypothetical protein
MKEVKQETEDRLLDGNDFVFPEIRNFPELSLPQFLYTECIHFLHHSAHSVTGFLGTHGLPK